MKKISIPLPSLCLILTVILLILTGCSNRSAPATSTAPPPGRDLEVEQQIESQLNEIDPAAVPLFRQATVAMDAGEYEQSWQLYEQVSTLAPNFSPVYRRLGYIAAYTSSYDQSVGLMRHAMELESDAYNQTALALALIYRNSATDKQEAFELSSAAINTLPDDPETVTVWLLSAVYVEDYATLRLADERLLRVAPGNPLAHYFAGLLAADDGRWEKAESELFIAQQLGMSPEAVQDALNNDIARNALLFRIVRWAAIATLAWLLGLGILYLAGTILSKATLRVLSDSQQISTNLQIKPQENKVRSIYRLVVVLLSLYFYISIPFVILLLFLVVGGAFYIFLKLQTIPIYFALILVLMVFGSLIAILRSVFSKFKDLPMGRDLQRMDAPECWALVEDVAKRLSVRPVDKIFITPYAEIAVSEKGGILKKIRGTGRRNLLLGMGALPGLSQGQLAAILAHEYGHFSNRDTAGGNLAFKVYASLYQMTQRLIQTGAARIYNPVWLFVIGYRLIFFRVTQGASRLQEILADRFAAMTYGGNNFIDGLQNLIRQSITFGMQADKEIKTALEVHRPIINIYDVPMTNELLRDCGEKFEDAMKRKTSQFDSHPAPQERILMIERLHIPYSPIHDNPQPALHLFPNSTELQLEMTSLLTSRLPK